MANFGTVNIAIDVTHQLALGTTPDGHAEVVLLYSPEPFEFGSDDDRSIHLWVRRCSVHSSRENAIDHLNGILSDDVQWRPYDPLFPELWIGFDSRGSRWLLESAPVDALKGYQPPEPASWKAALGKIDRAANRTAEALRNMQADGGHQ